MAGYGPAGTLSHPTSYRHVTVGRMMPVLWSLLLVPAIVGAVIWQSQASTHRAQADLIRSAEPVQVVPASYGVAAFVDTAGEPRLVEVRGSRRSGRRGGARPVPRWGQVAVAYDVDGTAHAWLDDRLPRVPPAWQVHAARAAALAGIVTLVLLVGNAVRRFRRVRDAGYDRTRANTALLLDPLVLADPDGPHDPPLPGQQPDRMAVLLADRRYVPVAAPWAEDEATAPPVGSWRARGYGWIAPLSILSLGGLWVAAWTQAFDGPTTTAAWVGVALVAVAVVVATAAVGSFEVRVGADGRLRVRRLLTRRTYDLSRLEQVRGWTWELLPGRPPEVARVVATHVWLRFADGRSLHLPVQHLHRRRTFGAVLRYWAEHTGAEVSSDAAYVLGFTTDPRDAPPPPLRPSGPTRHDRRPRGRFRARLTSNLAVTLLATALPVVVLGPVVAALWHDEQADDPRPLLVDPCATVAAVDPAAVTRAGDVEPGVFLRCDATSSAGTPVTVWWSPSASVYSTVLHSFEDRGFAFLRINDRAWLDRIGAMQAHVLVTSDDHVSLLARTTSGTTRVVADGDATLTAELLVEHLRRDGIRPVEPGVEVVDLPGRVRNWAADDPVDLHADRVRQALDRQGMETLLPTD